ncbi:four-helix bundle copper-binding protein [Tundrisphaera sp. TA3]|uniref:four-helix bundle copper-binding protein n=1 Tax=Tundrisphaera sp. TA3 TaxID=3435775 RepID=UPI003EBB75C8
MDRRTMFGLMGAGAVGMVAMPGAGAVAAAPAADDIHEECLKACSDCAKACEMAVNHCLKEVGMGKKEHAKPLRYVMDCAGFCALSAKNIASHSPMMALSCESCGEACKETMEQVAAFDSPEMKAVAAELKRCEASCRKMVAAMGHKHSH